MSRRSIKLDDEPKPTRRRKIALKESCFVITGKKRGAVSLRVTDSVRAIGEDAARAKWEEAWTTYDIEEVKEYER
jgi:hypothetical protein